MTQDEAQRLYELVADHLLFSLSEKLTANGIIYVVEKTLLYREGGQVAAEFRRHCLGSKFVLETERRRLEHNCRLEAARAQHMKAAS